MPPLQSRAVGIETRQYQTRGVAFLWDKKRAMLTDAPGLGKTPQAALASQPPVLVVCPAYLVEHWAEWLSQHFPTMSVAVARKDRQSRIKALRIEADWTVCNVQMLRTHLPYILTHKYSTVIFDESHHLKNRNAEQSQGALKIAKVTPRVYLLTATPIWKEIDDLFMQLRIMQPDIFTSYWRFVNTFCFTDETRFGTRILGARTDTLPELEGLLNCVRLGRSYSQASRQLPSVNETTIKIEFPPGLKKVYKDLKDNFKVEVLDLQFPNYMSVMHTLRQLTAFHGKIDAVKNVLLDNKRDGGEVVFTWYRDTAELIHNALPGSVLITGALPPAERRSKALAAKLAVATISSLSEGIDLSHAKTIVFAEQHWPPGAGYQAISRVVRERKNKTDAEPVNVYYVHVKDTIDETIHKVSKTTRRYYETTGARGIGNL